MKQPWLVSRLDKGLKEREKPDQGDPLSSRKRRGVLFIYSSFQFSHLFTKRRRACPLCLRRSRHSPSHASRSSKAILNLIGVYKALHHNCKSSLSFCSSKKPTFGYCVLQTKQVGLFLGTALKLPCAIVSFPKVNLLFCPFRLSLPSCFLNFSPPSGIYTSFSSLSFW